MRPDPDTLLKRISAEAAKERRARLKVFFGFAPGVGKTYRMLQVARELLDQKVDVVVGAVETHARYDTGALLLGLEIIPKRVHDYRGKSLEEFDLDAALRRKPRVLLLDELAHTNVPGSRHLKRWQDAVELLDAGIDVYTTLNVQHVESLNDVVAQITSVQVRETVPDTLLERADEVELVDIAPEELLNRLREGKVYLPDQVARAASGFFQRGNLLALRELALRRTAERVDADVLAWREEQGVSQTWPTSERIMVCVGPAPASSRLIRAGRRMAAGLRAPWEAVWVESLTPVPTSEADRQRLEQHLKLAESLGASVVRLTGTRVSTVLLDHARKANVTRLIIGKPTHSRLWDRLKGSLLDEVVRGSGDVDVHVISGDSESASEPRRGPPPEPERLAAPAWVAGALLPVLTTALAMGIRALAPIPDVEMLYLLAVIIAAVRGGRGPAVLAAALSVAAYDFCFVPPYYTFRVADARYLLTFAMMFGVALLAGTLAARIRRQEREAVQREERTGSLFALSRELVTLASEDQAALSVARHVSSSFDAPVVVLLKGRKGPLAPVSAWPAGTTLDAAQLGVAQWVAEHGRLAGVGTDTLPGAKALCAPLRTAAGGLGVVALVPKSAEGLSAEQRALLEALGAQAASALERVRLAGDAEAASLRAKTEEMRSSLLSSVSHDLRTPLAAITGAATALKDTSAPLPEPQRAELIESICDEAERLERLVGNLLDMTRLDSGAVQPKREWVPVDELVASALERMQPRLATRPLVVKVPEGLPLLHVDPVLMEQVLINLLENALKYTPDASPLEVEAAREENELRLEVRDRGPGIAQGSEERVFEKFYRGDHATSGAGLGLPICKGIVEAHGGRVAALPREGGGAVFRVALPVPKEQPS